MSRDVSNSLAEESGVYQAGSVREATDRTSDSPDWIVLFQDHPGEFADSDFQRIEQTWPLARTLLVGGDWCDSDGRTARPRPGVIRIRAHDFESCGWDWEQSLSVPRTANDSDRFLAEARCHRFEKTGHVLIVAHSPADRETLADAVQSLGFAAISESPPVIPRAELNERFSEGLDALKKVRARFYERERAQCQAAIWDLRFGSEAEWMALGEFLHRNQCPVVVLLGFMRPEDVVRARQLDVTVIAKPFRFGQFATAIARATDSPSRSPCSQAPGWEHHPGAPKLELGAM